MISRRAQPDILVSVVCVLVKSAGLTLAPWAPVPPALGCAVWSHSTLDQSITDRQDRHADQNLVIVPQLIETWCQETGTGRFIIQAVIYLGLIVSSLGASYLFLGMWILGDASNVVAAVVHGLLTQVGRRLALRIWMSN